MAATPRGRPRAEPRDSQRDRILRAARAAFTEHGYDAVTLSAIARDARVPRAVVYEVVGSKEAVLAAVADGVADELIAAVDERFATADHLDLPVDQLVRADVEWFVALMAGEPSYGAIIRAGQRAEATGADPVSRARARLEDRITELHLARGRAFGFERPASARILAAMVLALFESVALRLGEPGWPGDAVAELVGEFAAGGYLRAELSGATARFDDRAAVDPPP